MSEKTHASRPGFLLYSIGISERRRKKKKKRKKKPAVVCMMALLLATVADRPNHAHLRACKGSIASGVAGRDGWLALLNGRLGERDWHRDWSKACMEELVKSGRGAGVTGEARRYVIKSPSPGAHYKGAARMRTFHAQDVLVRVLVQLQYHQDKHFGLVVGSSTSCIRVYIHDIRMMAW